MNSLEAFGMDLWLLKHSRRSRI